MTGLAFMGLLGKVETELKKATRIMEHRKDSLSISNSMHNSFRVSKSHDVTMNETLMLSYFEAVDKVEKLLAQKNRVIELLEEKLSLMKTNNGADVIRARYIDGRKME